MGQGVLKESRVGAVLGVHDLELLLFEENANEPLDVGWAF